MTLVANEQPTTPSVRGAPIERPVPPIESHAPPVPPLPPAPVVATTSLPPLPPVPTWSLTRPHPIAARMPPTTTSLFMGCGAVADSTPEQQTSLVRYMEDEGRFDHRPPRSHRSKRSC